VAAARAHLGAEHAKEGRMVWTCYRIMRNQAWAKK
jgi:hypothetical protein